MDRRPSAVTNCRRYANGYLGAAYAKNAKRRIGRLAPCRACNSNTPHSMPKSSCDSIRALRDLTRRCSRKSNEQFAPWGWNNFQINRPFLNINQIIQFIAHKIFAPDVLMYFLFASYFTSPVFCAPMISPIRARSMCVYVGGMCAMRFILCDEPFVRSITIIERDYL